MSPTKKQPETGHHLILGKLTDFITGKVLDDTLDERYRQKIARLLVEAKGFSLDEIVPRYKLQVAVDDKKAVVPIDILIHLNVHSDQKGRSQHESPQIENGGIGSHGKGAFAALIKFGPGSLVTRHQPALAAARLVADYQVPLVIVTNGESAHTLETSSGKLLFEGLEMIPNRAWVVDFLATNSPRSISGKIWEMAARIVYCYEVDGACPCDTSVCKLE